MSLAASLYPTLIVSVFQFEMDGSFFESLYIAYYPLSSVKNHGSFSFSIICWVISYSMDGVIWCVLGNQYTSLCEVSDSSFFLTRVMR